MNEDQSARVAKEVVEAEAGGPISEDRVIPISSGTEVNTVYEVDERFIVRLRDNEDAAWEYRKERWCLHRARSLGIPVPEVVGLGEVQGFHYVIHTKVNGLRGDDPSIQPGRVWESLGAYAHALNGVEAQGYGRKFLNRTIQSNFSWQQWVESQLLYIFGGELLVVHGLFTRDESRWFRERIRSLSEARFTPVLCHANMVLKNTMVMPSGEVALLDWGDAGGYPPGWDLSELFAWHDGAEGAAEHFLRGYGMEGAEARDLLPCLDAVLVWRWLISIRWAITSVSAWETRAFVRESHERAKRVLSR